jgi:UTP--glucose-1-phosphate uridylyltransferase
MHSDHPSPASSDESILRGMTTLICAEKAFENTSTSVAASQMRNALNNLADTVEDPEQKKVRLSS